METLLCHVLVVVYLEIKPLGMNKSKLQTFILKNEKQLKGASTQM